MYFVAVDIGCIECGASSHVMGIFTTREAAEAICRKGEAMGWIGEQHDYTVFEVEALDEIAWHPVPRDTPGNSIS